MRTKEEIALQIEGLKNEKETVPAFSNFGDANHEKIDAQLDVLEGLKEPDDFYKSESDEDFEQGDNDVYFAALEAEEWLNSSEVYNLFGE